MEIDDLDREIQRLHDTVLLKRRQLAARPSGWPGAGWSADRTSSATSPRFATKRRARPKRGAYRALKVYERDVLGRVVSPDESKAYDLLLDWLKKQEAIARMDVDDRGFTLKQTRSLYQRNAVSPPGTRRCRAGLQLGPGQRRAEPVAADAGPDGACRPQGREAVRPRRIRTAEGRASQGPGPLFRDRRRGRAGDA